MYLYLEVDVFGNKYVRHTHSSIPQYSFACATCLLLFYLTLHFGTEKVAYIVLLTFKVNKQEYLLVYLFTQ